MDKYKDRKHAGQILANHLKLFRNKEDVLILALPRGGVPVAFEIAKELSLYLDVLLVRKLGVPGHEELALGAIAMEGTIFINEDIVRQLTIPNSVVEKLIKKEKKELKRRSFLYRKGKKFLKLEGKTILLVDDGIATGATVRAAIATLKKKKAAKMIIVTPVMAKSTYDELIPLVDDIICPLQPINFFAVAAWYEEFPQTSDEEVCDLLVEANRFYSEQDGNLRTSRLSGDQGKRI